MTRAPAATLRLGTRRSPLALQQAAMVRAVLLAAAPDLRVELVEIVSEGDRDPRQLHEIGERGIFARELERALLEERIDLAVHSSKDLALDAAPQLQLAAWLRRGDVRDALVGPSGGLDDLPPGARVATGSARRIAQLRTLRPDIEPVPIRGNVQTRIERAQARGDAACMLALAGLERLGLLQVRSDVTALDEQVVVPEAGQGAVVVQTRAGDEAFDWSEIDHQPTRRAVTLERAVASRLGGGCDRPQAVHVRLEERVLLAFAAPAPNVGGRHATVPLAGPAVQQLVDATTCDAIDAAAHAAADGLHVPLALELQLADPGAPT